MEIDVKNPNMISNWACSTSLWNMGLVMSMIPNSSLLLLDANGVMLCYTSSQFARFLSSSGKCAEIWIFPYIKNISFALCASNMVHYTDGCVGAIVRPMFDINMTWL